MAEHTANSTEVEKPDERLSMAALKAMPKIDLHRHFEGSLRLETLLDIGREHGLNLPTRDLERLRPYVQMTDDPHRVEAFLAKFEVLRDFYRSEEAVRRLAYEAVADAAKDNVRYLELRFAPQALARVRGYAFEEVTDWVIDETRRAGQDFQIGVGLIVTLVRHDPLPQSFNVAQMAFDRVGKGIVGLDLAGNEIKFPPGPFRAIFEDAKHAGLGITIHAGEWCSAAGVQQVIEELHADRIGHGVRTIENSRVLQLVRDRNLALEVCLTSNLQTGVVRSIDHHPVVDLLDLGLRVTLNTDDPRISDCTLTDEYKVAVEAFGFNYRDLRQVILNAAESAFLPEPERKRLVAQFEAYLPADAAP